LKADFTRRDKTSPQNLSGIKRADENFGQLRATELSSKHIAQYIEKQQAEGYANASINRITGLIGQAFQLAMREREGQLVRVPYIERLSEKENARQGFTDAATFDQIRENLPEDLRDFAQFAFSTGWRKNEIAGLDWSNGQDGDTMIRLRPEQAKNKNGRSVPVTGELVDVIGRRRGARQLKVGGTTEIVNLVFHRHGAPIREFRKAWKRACLKANVPGLLFHDLRRSAVTAMIQAKVPQLVAMQLSGHRTNSMFRYGIMVEDGLRDAMAATEAYHETRRQKQARGNVRSIAK
jgi:integrase